LLVQLPIPPVGPEPIRGNVPLAGGYLKMYAERHGLAADYQIDILPTVAANTLGDRGLVQEILAAEPWMVGFTCYLWNIQRTLWIAARLKEARPELLILLGGPEITADNDWVLRDEAVDFAAIGEGEQTFCELLQAMRDAPRRRDGREEGEPISGLFVRQSQQGGDLFLPPPRKPLANLDQISSPYLAGILDAADEQMLLLETIRGCIFKCKFCYYPKSYDSLYFLSEEKIVANLEHARRRGAREVVLLDPTLNQRRDFSAFLKLLARCNPQRQFTYFGELRAEGITPDVAQLLRDANFTEVEIGLQSIDPLAMELMDRKNNLRAFERGARAMLDLGIKVKVDLIIGLPGDTVDSVRRGLDYIHASGLYSEVQVFNLAILPGTSFRQEAAMLGLEFQDRPPYYVLKTPTLDLPQMFELMQEAQELFETEFDPLPEPALAAGACERMGTGSEQETVFGSEPRGVEVPVPILSHAGCAIDLDHTTIAAADQCLPPAAERSQAFTLRLRSTNFDRQRATAEAIVAQLLEDNPYTTLQLILEPTIDPRSLSPATLESLLAVCFRNPTYLDRFYSVLPGRPKGAKRLIVALQADQRAAVDQRWIREIGELAAIVWHGVIPAGAELLDYEYVEAAAADDARCAIVTRVAAR
jgi:radical SAM superfamily enzyme YgiQ (UPF0313 family)